MSRNMTADPKAVARNADRVAAQHEEHESAIDAEEDAYAELLEAVLEAAAPALPALSSAVPDYDELNGLLLLRVGDLSVWWIHLDDPSELRWIGPERDDGGRVKEFALEHGRQGVVDAIMQVAVSLDAQLRGGKHKATEKIRRRAVQIHALATLAKALS